MIFRERSNSLNRFRFAIVAGILLLLSSLAPAIAGSYEDYFNAVKKDQPNVVRSLLARGFDPNTIDETRGDTGMILALREGSMKVFKVLLDAPGVNIEITARNGDTALMMAAFRGNKPAVEALLEKGAQINRPGWTALHYAAASGSNDVISLLLEQHAYIDTESPNRTTPIMMAAWGGHIMSVKLLLDEGADPTLVNEVGMNAVDFAQRAGYPDIVDGLRYRIKRAAEQAAQPR